MREYLWINQTLHWFIILKIIRRIHKGTSWISRNIFGQTQINSSSILFCLGRFNHDLAVLNPGVVVNRNPKMAEQFRF